MSWSSKEFVLSEGFDDGDDNDDEYSYDFLFSLYNKPPNGYIKYTLL